MERENGKLREEMHRQVDEFQRQIELRESDIRGLNQRLENSQHFQMNEIQSILKKENEAYKQENRLLRDKNAQLNHELDSIPKNRAVGKNSQILETEISHLRQQLAERDRDAQKQAEYFKSLISEKDQTNTKQKNEWAEIYGNMKQEIEDLKSENRMLNIESEKLIKQLELGGGAGGNRQLEKELAKKLKKRELECSALWETLKDMHVSGRNVFDARQMLDILALRALDTKAKRKLKL